MLLREWTIPADREFDAEIAQKVLGLTVAKGVGLYCLQPVIQHRPDDGTLAWHDMDNGQSHLPCYSTNIAAAWPILAIVRNWPSMKRAAFHAGLRTLVTIRLDRDYFRVSELDVLLNMTADDICRAALEGVGERMMPAWYYEPWQPKKSEIAPQDAKQDAPAR